MDTPCVNICSIDPATRLCQGCGRTVPEIASWSTLTPQQRLKIMSGLPARMVAAGLTAPAAERSNTGN